MKIKKIINGVEEVIKSKDEKYVILSKAKLFKTIKVMKSLRNKLSNELKGENNFSDKVKTTKANSLLKLNHRIDILQYLMTDDNLDALLDRYNEKYVGAVLNQNNIPKGDEE